MKKIILIMCSVLLIAGLLIGCDDGAAKEVFSGTQTSSTDNTLTYMVWNSTNLVENSTSDYEVVTNETATLEAGKFYVVKGANVQTSTLTVNGTTTNPTTLIICNGAKLTVTGSDGNAGITVASDKALIITGQLGGTGRLEVTGGYESAGIGGGMSSAGGDVTINGGTINVAGGLGAAGIGGGYHGAVGTVTINGGTITATGGSEGTENGAGIGGGYNGNGGCVTINGGMITATGGSEGAVYGAGIGGGGGFASTGTVAFKAGGSFIVKAGDDSGSATEKTTTDYTTDHSAAYVHIEQIPVATPTFKAVYNATGGANTLTFYYDAVDHSGVDITVYDNLPTVATKDADWCYNGIRSNVKSVVIDVNVKD